LTRGSQDLCTIITPFGKYKYLILLIGLKCSPDIAQAVLDIVLSKIEDAEVYIKGLTSMMLVLSPVIGITMSNC
jgi:hypothetical protein